MAHIRFLRDRCCMFRLVLGIGAGVLLAGGVSAEPRMFWVPQGEDSASYVSGTTVVPTFTGARVCMELRLQALGGGFEICAAQGTVPCLREPFGAGTGTVALDESSMAADPSHPDHVGFDIPDFGGWCDGTPDTVAVWLGGQALGEPMIPLPVAPDSGYMGEGCFEMSSDAVGEFRVEYFGLPEIATLILINDHHDVVYDAVFDPLVFVVDEAVPCGEASECDDLSPCTHDACSEGRCVNTPVPYGDLTGNGVANLFDALCVLEILVSDFTHCDLINADIAPTCDGDGFVNLLDLFAVLDAMAGVDPCCQ